jgi:hypothetical protein
MPALFVRLGEGFARDPARGFLDQLARLEGPAPEGITLSIEEGRQAGRRARADYLAQAAARGYQVVHDPVRLAYLRDLVAGLAPRMRSRAGSRPPLHQG